MGWLRRIWSDIRQGENVDLYLTIVVSVTVGVIGLFGLAQDHISSLTLAVLALLAFSILKSRYQAEELGKKLDDKSGTTVGLDTVFSQEAPVLVNRLRRAKNISHNGISLVGSSNALLGTFSECLANGGQIRLLAVNPDHEALQVAASRFNKHQNAQLLKREVEHALDNFRSLASEGNPGFELRLFEAVPAYSIWLIDTGLPTAEIWVGLYSFRDDLEPWLHLLPHKDGVMFDFFSQQFEQMWQSSQQWERDKS